MANRRQIEPYWWNSLIGVFTLRLFNCSLVSFSCSLKSIGYINAALYFHSL